MIAPLLLLMLLSFSAQGEESAGFTIELLETHLKEDHYLMDARVEYRLSKRALEALDNGVPITLDLQVELVEVGGSWLWTEYLLDTHIRHTIRYHSLAESYQLFEHNTQETSNFVTRAALLSELGEISNFVLIKAEQLQPKKAYQLRVNAALDIESLPLLLRPMAYLQPEWKQSSGWSRWPLER